MKNRKAAANRHADTTAGLMAEVHRGIDHGAGCIHLGCFGTDSATHPDCPHRCGPSSRMSRPPAKPPPLYTYRQSRRWKRTWPTGPIRGVSLRTLLGLKECVMATCATRTRGLSKERGQKLEFRAGQPLQYSVKWLLALPCRDVGSD